MYLDFAYYTPTKVVFGKGAEAQVGSITVSKQADFALLDSDGYALTHTFIDGVCVFGK